MRILIDLQGAQTGSRFRGIGRYSLGLTKAIVRNRGEHEVLILLNGLFAEEIDDVKIQFSPYLNDGDFIVFYCPSPVLGAVASNSWRREAAELIREWVISFINPDVLLITSLFEGAIEDGVTSIRRLEPSPKVAVVLHDLIPFLDPDAYLDEPGKKWYFSKIESLRKADLLLAVSDSARREATDALGFDNARTVSIYSAVDERFRPIDASIADHRELLERFGIRRKFVMHVSSFEARKNFEGLLRAYAVLRDSIREDYQLVLVARGSAGALDRLADELGLRQGEVVILDYISDNELVVLYSLCTLFIFPTFHEGFGLPALEAMSCGAAVIGSNRTSIPEVIGRQDALFDPESIPGMAALIERALTDRAFHADLKAYALESSKQFSWDRSARLALGAMEKIAPRHSRGPARADRLVLLEKIAAIRTGVAPERQDLIAVADSIAKNEQTSEEIARQRPLLNNEGDTTDRIQDATAAPPSDAPPSDPVIEVIRHQVWSPNDSPRILILKLDHIGDFILTLNAFRLLRKTWPKAQITLVCGSWNTRTAEQSGLFDVVVGYDFFPPTGANHDKAAALAAGRETYRALGLGTYDLAVDLRCHSDDNRMLLTLTDAKYRAGYAAPGVKLDLALAACPESELTAHVGARCLALAAAVAWTFGTPAGGARDGILRGRVPVRLFDDGVIVGIAPGTGNPIKSWGAERFAQLARLLHDKGGYQFVLIGGSSDRADTQSIANLLPKADFIDLAGVSPIDDLPPVIAGLDLFIGNDAGPTHMAALMGVPTVCVYSGQTYVDAWRPVGPHVITLRGNVRCAPCYRADCPWDKRCMDIPPARVAAEAIALLERVGSAHRPRQLPSANSGHPELFRATNQFPGGEASAHRPTDLAPQKRQIGIRRTRPKLAFLSPLPPLKSGIADYSAELLPELANHYEIELITDQQEVECRWAPRNFPIRNVRWFGQHAARFDRILYHFGNSEFHKHMFDLQERFPGVIVLHDFYLSGVIDWMDATGFSTNNFVKSLYYSHGYQGLAALAREGRKAVVSNYPVNKAVLDRAAGVIVHSHFNIEAAEHWYGEGTSREWHVIPHLRALPPLPDRKQARDRLGIPENEFLLCSFGILHATKQSYRLLEAFLASPLAQDRRCQLVFVGENQLGSSIEERIDANNLGGRIRMIGYADRQLYSNFLTAADATVQLRTMSRGESSGTVLDALAHGLPLVINANGPMAELPDDCLIKLSDEFDDDALVRAVVELWQDQELRTRLGRAGREWIRLHHDPGRVAELYRDAIEACAGSARAAANGEAGARHDLGEEADAAMAVRVLYKALLNREADPEGLANCVSQLDAGRRPLHQIALDFVRSEEFRARHGKLLLVDNT